MTGEKLKAETWEIINYDSNKTTRLEKQYFSEKNKNKSGERQIVHCSRFKHKEARWLGFMVAMVRHDVGGGDGLAWQWLHMMAEESGTARGRGCRGSVWRSWSRGLCGGDWAGHGEWGWSMGWSNNMIKQKWGRGNNKMKRKHAVFTFEMLTKILIEAKVKYCGLGIWTWYILTAIHWFMERRQFNVLNGRGHQRKLRH